MRVLLLSLLMGVNSLASSREDRNYEFISEVDLGFLMTQPRFPWGEDPFLRKPGFSIVSSDPEKFVLSGVLTGAGVPMAVVNGKKVEAGDRIGTRIVKEIGPNFVILKKKDSEIELTIPSAVEEIPEDESDEPEDEK
jgi:hypothetical protein